ncbi:hypothetical protein ACFSKL_08215 [Belliella marina]|uniref:Uncharacterized protein n=1 Tax=Belliella marina TaxID=1644146 RepID=A0ABW4VKX4_9BACT
MKPTFPNRNPLMTIKSLPILVIFIFSISCKENISSEELDSDFITIIIPEDLSNINISWEKISE